VQGFFEVLKKFGPGRLAAMLAVTLGLLGFFGFVVMKFSQPTMSPLYTGLDMRDSASIIKELEGAGVTYELRGDGSSIFVPRDQVARLRMTMAQSGLPAGGGMGYEIFDKTDSLSATNFVQNINQLRALEGELSRTIRSIDRVDQARVHLVIPEKALFQRDKEEPSASIALKVRGGLEPNQIRAIRHLVASAVEGLKPARVSIVDEQGVLLADGAGTDNAEGGSDDRQASYERRLSDQVQRIVENIVGVGRAKVQVSAELDFNRVTQTQDLYDPESKVVRSTQTREESALTASGRDQSVTVGNELPNASGNSGAQNPAQDQTKKSEETINYEISRTTKTEVNDGGKLKRVSVAVLVDGSYAKDAAGAFAYAPRPKEELDRITALVRSAIGYDQQRGDQIEVVNLRFAEGPAAIEAAVDQGWMAYFAFTKDDIVRMVEIGVLGILSLFVLLLVVRPLVRRMVAPEAPPQIEAPTNTAPGGSDNQALPGTSGAGHDENSRMPKLEENKTYNALELAQANGEIQQKSIERIGELVDRNPTETMSLIRTWLTEPEKAA